MQSLPGWDARSKYRLEYARQVPYGVQCGGFSSRLLAFRFTITKSRKQLTIAASAPLGAAIQPLRTVDHEASQLNGSPTERVRQRYLEGRHLQ